MKAGAWRKMLRPLVPLYAGANAAKELSLERGWLRQRRLAHPVISVGSLSVGGAGKTPVVLMLAEMLGARGFTVRILTRGYGRAGTAIERVDANGDAARFGDEPLMMARRLTGASVWVGADRYRAGRLSEAADATGAKVVYLLDDGFQHRKLVRDIDVVLLTRQDLLDSLLPVGGLREPLKAMRRADIVVLRDDEGFAGGISGKAATWFIRRELRFPEGIALPKKALAFCGLARPESFFAMLAAAGVEVVATSVFRDHHAYSTGDIEELVKLARAYGADGFVTSQKDAIKLDEALKEPLRQIGPLVVPELCVSLDDEDTSLDDLIARMNENFAGRSHPASDHDH